MSQSGESGCIHITNSFDFLVDSCIFKNGWGRNGVITVIAGCEHGYLTHCRFEASYNIPMWLDGFKNGFVSGNYFNHLCNGSIHIAANTDIIRMSERVQIYNNTMMSKNYAIALGGANSCLIVNNLISPVFGCSPILLRGASVGELTWDCFDNSFLGNTFIRQNPENGIYGKVFVLTGDIAHNRIVRNNYFHNNLIRGNWECGFYLEENSNYNEFTYNKISLTNGGVATGDSGGGGITGNVVSPNY